MTKTCTYEQGNFRTTLYRDFTFNSPLLDTTLRAMEDFGKLYFGPEQELTRTTEIPI